MKTSYFNNIPFIDTDIYAPVSISIYAPEWYVGLALQQLAPTSDILSKYKRGLLTKEQYIERYTQEVLAKYSAKSICRRIENLVGDKEAVLMCYEKPKDFCHRHLVAKWFNTHGILVEELK